MVFSSITFLYYFLPIVLLFYFVIPSKYRNFILLLASLCFYFYGEQGYVWILLLSCIGNYLGGILLSSTQNKKTRKAVLLLTIVLNLGLLCYFKYTNFLLENINSIFSTSFGFMNIIMPIGISFFTFQTLSYVIDVYQNKVKANRNLIDFACYVCLFPQLVAGPIVRYADIDQELKTRKVTFDDFAQGVTRFTIGLSKKVLLANVIGELILALNGLTEMSILAYFVIAVSYSLQIYFDFSGYSDMAIGLGRMFGFHFPENFNYPFIAKSITDFWRRWHISLSKFLRDYVYIPLGGNKVNKIKHIRNIFIVWFLTGLWHGAAWNFIVWGLYFGVVLLMEKYFLKTFLDRHPILGHFYTIVIVMISFLIFSLEDMHTFFSFMKNMLGLTHLPLFNPETLYYVRSYFVVLVLAIAASTPWFKNTILAFKNKKSIKPMIDGLEIVGCIFLLTISTAFLIDSSFNPFLYFRF